MLLSAEKIAHEKRFLINLALSYYNAQHNTKFEVTDFDVYSIRKRERYWRAYEIYTKSSNDYLRMRIYFNLGKVTKLHEYLIESEENVINSLGTLLDEVFVILGDVSELLYIDKKYLFPVLLREFPEVPWPTVEYGFLLEDGSLLLNEEGGQLLPE